MDTRPNAGGSSFIRPRGYVFPWQLWMMRLLGGNPMILVCLILRDTREMHSTSEIHQLQQGGYTHGHETEATGLQVSRLHGCSDALMHGFAGEKRGPIADCVENRGCWGLGLGASARAHDPWMLERAEKRGKGETENCGTSGPQSQASAGWSHLGESLLSPSSPGIAMAVPMTRESHRWHDSGD